MSIVNNPCSSYSEKELFELLSNSISGIPPDDKSKRIVGLEEILRRIKSSTIQNKDEALRVLLDMTRIHGNSRPEVALLSESLISFLKQHGETYQTVLDELGKNEGNHFLCFSEIVLSLGYEQKRKTIPYLVKFLTTRDALNDLGAEETYDCLLSIGKQNLSKELVKLVLPYLDSNPDKLCAVNFSVRLCSMFAQHDSLPNMLNVLEKSMKGYYANSVDIEREICEFLGRVKDQQAIPNLLKLLEMRSNQSSTHIRDALANILDAHNSGIDDVLDALYDQDENASIDAILRIFEKMDTPVDAHKLMAKIRPKWWEEQKFARWILQNILRKGGQHSKTALFNLMKQQQDFALQCLKEIGVSREEIYKIFPRSPILQIYDFFYGKGALDKMLEETERLGNKPQGKRTNLDHLLSHVFSCFNFVIVDIDPSGFKGIDRICFYPETLDLFIIGSTTGTIKNDLQTIDSTIKKMKESMSDLFKQCSVTAIFVSSEKATIAESDKQYARQNEIVIMQLNNVETLLEILNTNRNGIDAIKYVKTLKIFPDSIHGV